MRRLPRSKRRCRCSRSRGNDNVPVVGWCRRLRDVSLRLANPCPFLPACSESELAPAPKNSRPCIRCGLLWFELAALSPSSAHTPCPPSPAIERRQEVESHFWKGARDQSGPLRQWFETKASRRNSPERTGGEHPAQPFQEGRL